MPKLLVFAPCSDVIISRGGNLSLITVLENLNLTLFQEVESLQDALVPRPWKVVTILESVDEEVGTSFDHRIVVTSPNGETIAGGESLDILVRDKWQHVIAEFPGFPAAPEGEYRVKGYVRPSGTKRWKQIASYPVVVKHRNQNTEEDPHTNS